MGISKSCAHFLSKSEAFVTDIWSFVGSSVLYILTVASCVHACNYGCKHFSFKTRTFGIKF